MVIFCKLPEPGRTKTRLCPPLTAAQAADLADVLLRQAARRFPDAVFCHAPADAGPTLRERYGVTDLLPQSDGNLGDRLIAARAALPEGHLLFLGTDSPDLPPEYVEAVAACTDPVAIGPTFDGGFWGLLVGPDVPMAELLTGVEWSSGREYRQVLSNVRRLGLHRRIAPVWSDLDYGEDLDRLRDRLTSGAWPELAKELAALNLPSGGADGEPDNGSDGQLRPSGEDGDA